MRTFTKLISRLALRSGVARIVTSILILAVCAGVASPQYAGEPRTARSRTGNSPPVSRSVVINATQLDNDTIYALEQQYHTRILDGRYWYDRVCGAWGIEGGPTRGFTLPGLNLGGPLRADASRGRTGVFVNGRELHRLDVLALQRIMRVRAGRYWVDGWGNGGFEGGPAIFNLVQLARAAGGGGTGARRSGSALTTWDRTGIAVF